jgi:hypothetical protein
MPYAIFDKDTKLSKAYPTEADVWKHARETGLIVDRSVHNNEIQEPVLDNDYQIRPCEADPREDPAQNEIDAEEAATEHPYLKS